MTVASCSAAFLLFLGYTANTSSTDARIDPPKGCTTPEFKVEFDKVWWGFLSWSESVICCQTGGTR
jgi:hypothetical protein